MTPYASEHVKYHYSDESIRGMQLPYMLFPRTTVPFVSYSCPLVKKYPGMAHVYLIKLTKYRRIYFIDGTGRRTLDCQV